MIIHEHEVCIYRHIIYSMYTVYDINIIIYSISLNTTYYMKYRCSEFNIEDTSHMLIILYVYIISEILCIYNLYIVYI